MYKVLFLMSSFLSFGSNLLAMQKPIEAAGILPFCVYKDKGYFLIGKSKFNHTYWSDFGGFRDKTDESIEYAAAREFSEETRHVFGRLLDDYSLNGSINYILPRIKSDQLLKNISKGKHKDQSHVYTMYIAEVDYISAKTFNEAAKVSNYDKEEYSWIPAEEFLHHCMGEHVEGIFEQKAMRSVFWDNLKEHKNDLPDILQAIRDTPSRPKIELPQQPDDADKAKGIAALLASITAPKLMVAAVVVGVCYWGYTKYKARKAAQIEEQEKKQEQEKKDAINQNAQKEQTRRQKRRVR